MNSNDQEIIIIVRDLTNDFSTINNKVDGLSKEIRDIKTEIRIINNNLGNLSNRINDSFVNSSLFFAGVTVIAALVALMPLIRDLYISFKNAVKAKKTKLTDNEIFQVKNLIRDEFARLKAESH